MTTEDIILNKSWKELTDHELDLVRELAADEASFNHMKSFMQQVAQIGAGELYEPSVSVKSGLDAVFTRQHAARMQPSEAFKAPVSKAVPIYQRNWTKIAAAAIFVVTAVLVWTWPGQQEVAPGPKLAQMDEPVVFSEWNPDNEKSDEAAPAEPKIPAAAVQAGKNDEPAGDMALKENASQGYTMNSAETKLLKEEVALSGAETRYETDDLVKPAMKAGMNADLFPDSFHPSSVAAASEDLLSYIKPAF